ncbi:hypothetical protein DFP72DRAFT_1171532 [Ephemerocybe angulata]|uniref:Uncharacterized protein n=1 Tax=Ephemerocybe angulata TaxID=980116 RepID=A0A8H6HT07_9AGAR|nr:hypothetical protein DFP72DRAFT_1171532 [Tulosesus angulatus]
MIFMPTEPCIVDIQLQHRLFAGSKNIEFTFGASQDIVANGPPVPGRPKMQFHLGRHSRLNEPVRSRHVSHSSSFAPARSRRAEVEPDSDGTFRLAGQFPSFPGTTKIEFSLSPGRSSPFFGSHDDIPCSSLRPLVPLEDCHDAPAAYGAMSVARSAALEFDGRRPHRHRGFFMAF